MISLLLEKISQKKAQLFPLFLPHHRDTQPIHAPPQKHTKDLQRHALLGQMTRGFFHDLLSPLAALQLYVEHTQKSTQDSAYGSIVADIHSELCAFITTIQFNLKNPNQKAEVCFHDLCITASTLLKHKLTENNIRLIVLGEKELAITTYPLYLIQIITNGLHNAVDALSHSDLSGRKTITLLYEMNQGHLTFTIHDTGEGIPEEIQENIFNLYTSTKENGHGIGLHTTKNIVTDIFEGTISLTSQEDQGTTLTVDLPMDLQSPESPDHSNQDQRN